MSLTRLLMLAPLIALLYLGGCNRKDESGGQAKSPAGTVPAPLLTGGTPIELEYVPDGFPHGLAVSQGFALHLFDTPGSDQKFGKLPPESGSKRHFDELHLAGHGHLVVTEEGPPLRMHFDENRNGDMTDDRGVFVAEKEGFLPNNLSIQIRYEQEKVVAPYRMWLFGSNMGGVRFYPVCHWRGTLGVDGQSYTIVAFDANADGDYGNDPLVIDLDNDGKAGEGESLMPGQTATAGGKVVKLLGVSPSGLTARFDW